MVPEAGQTLSVPRSSQSVVTVVTHNKANRPTSHAGFLPEVENRFSGTFLVDKHILPVHHREGVEHRAKCLDSCGQCGTLAIPHTLLWSANPASSWPPDTPHRREPGLYVPRETPMLGPILRRECTWMSVLHTTSQAKCPGMNCMVAAR